eukprot:CAMPEP_0195016466 /NCGR_PEP_ID=MMETSP0326_2-20130528/24392_1 /TAXON_ID=2866 ORGANISM="Crypthecodinium cohnii, Strain Seligo" /NCGR_SAMPLE_ID=MMETSP0326_2 /ASSEMBLY_ACC=CAM_ASM_000348 /LENGTH=57 /DNA_ID=CAMNT_0040032125 /DNA_START=235 /DNA_END=408 /DNA_ORIENTATION=+
MSRHHCLHQALATAFQDVCGESRLVQVAAQSVQSGDLELLRASVPHHRSLRERYGSL